MTETDKSVCNMPELQNPYSARQHKNLNQVPIGNDTLDSQNCGNKNEGDVMQELEEMLIDR